MTNMPFQSDPSAPTSELDDSATPVGSAGLNADSVSVNGIELGEASDDDVGAHIISTETLQRTSERRTVPQTEAAQDSLRISMSGRALPE
jgi:hypothetical protein